jgi:NAD(P)-dependent dehydrogenase (short-subunit alcohol dehydrogenase family)
MAGRLEGKVALITGTAGGQGRAAAVLFAREGAKVVGCDLNVDGAKETVAMAKAAGGEMVSMQPVDLSDGKQVKKWIDFAIATYGHFDILYNNAAGGARPPQGQMPEGWGMSSIDKLTEEGWQHAVRNELDLIYHACHYAWPHLEANGHGVIINTASIAGIVGSAWIPGRPAGGMVAHCAMKGGVRALTRELALQGGPIGIRVVAICPGVIEIEPGTRAGELEWIPMHRVGVPDDIAKTALFLASDDASYITGTDIIVDGGITAH